MKISVVAKLMILLTAVALTVASCVGPKPCWGTSSDNEEPGKELVEVV
jgi:hypothetical protein